jgi:hypothetical protein
MMQAIRSSEKSVLTTAIRRDIPQEVIHHNHRRQNLESQISFNSPAAKADYKELGGKNFTHTHTRKDTNFCQMPSRYLAPVDGHKYEDRGVKRTELR